MRRLTGVAARLSGVLALAATVGCDGSGGPIPFSQFEPTALAAVCRFSVLCRIYPDQATCMASEQTEPHFYDTLGQDVASGEVSYDGTAARACVDAINGLSACTRTAYAGVASGPACNTIFTGTVAVGGACFFSEECVGGGTCLRTASCTSDQCCAGTCQAPEVTVPLGGSCSPGATVCATGAVCITDATSGSATCGKPVAAGGACTSTSVCAAGLYCDVAATMTCKAPVATGGACNPSLDSQDCDNEFDRCDSNTSICTSPLSVGSACSPSTTATCVDYAICDVTSGTCVARPVVGAACSASTPSCLGGSCDPTTSTCALAPTAGACS